MLDGFQTIGRDRSIRVWIELDAPVSELFCKVGERFPSADLMRKRFDQTCSLLLVDLALPRHPVQVFLELLRRLAIFVQSKMLMVEI